MDPLREAAETIRSFVSDDSADRLIPDGLTEAQHYMGVSLLVLAKSQLKDLDRLLANPDGELSDLTLPEDFARTVDATITSGQRVYEWRHLASVMQSVDQLFRLMRQQSPEPG